MGNRSRQEGERQEEFGVVFGEGAKMGEGLRTREPPQAPRCPHHQLSWVWLCLLPVLQPYNTLRPFLASCEAGRHARLARSSTASPTELH